jgi:capsular exopolysaccharide synthesis family protein
MAVRNVVLGALLGLLCGAGLAVARVLLDRSVTETGDAEQLTGAPAIGLVFRDDSLNDQHTIERVGSRTAEQYRQLATSLQYLNVDAPPKVIMVSSAVPAEGKTTMAINLAIALAEAGHRVTIVEADLRRPKVVEYLGLVSGAGVTNLLAGSADLGDVVQVIGEAGLRVIAAGPTPPNPGRLLGSSQMAVLLDQLRRDYDYVLVDAAPILPVADSRGLAAHVDGVLLSVRHGSTTKDQLSETAAALDGVGATTLGVVLNMVPLQGDLAAAHAYGLDYGYAAGRETAAGAEHDVVLPMSRQSRRPELTGRGA